MLFTCHFQVPEIQLSQHFSRFTSNRDLPSTRTFVVQMTSSPRPHPGFGNGNDGIGMVAKAEANDAPKWRADDENQSRANSIIDGDWKMTRSCLCSFFLMRVRDHGRRESETTGQAQLKPISCSCHAVIHPPSGLPVKLLDVIVLTS